MNKIQTHRHTTALIILLFALTLSAGCGRQAAFLDCPFTSLSWDATIENTIALEGDSCETYDSLYGGTTYTFPKEYHGHLGTIKYMFDEHQALKCVAWMYDAKSAEELNDIYQELYEQISGQLGSQGYLTDESSNSGAVWYRKEGNVLLLSMLTDSVKAIQFSYLHPDVSDPETSTSPQS